MKSGGFIKHNPNIPIKDLVASLVQANILAHLSHIQKYKEPSRYLSLISIIRRSVCVLQKDVKILVRCALSEQCSGAGAVVERPNLPEQVRRWALRQAGAEHSGRQSRRGLVD